MATIHKLTDPKCKSDKSLPDPGKKIRKLADGGGLFLWVHADGRRYWRFRYMVGGKEGLMSVGVYPDVSLAEARRKAAELRLQDDPGKERKQAKAPAVVAGNTFDEVAQEWLALRAEDWTPKHAADLLSVMVRYAFPLIGAKPIGELESPDILKVLKKIQDAGKLTTGLKMLPIFTRIFKYAKGKGLCQRIITSDISAKDSLRKAKPKKHAAVTEEALPELLRMIDTLESQQTKLAIKLVFLTFVRANELLKAEWSEFDLENALWTIPANRMKNRLIQLVPLSKQALEILAELKLISGNSQWVFPGRSYEKPMVSNTLLVAYDTLGYKGDMTSHGARHIASTTLNSAEKDERPMFHADAIERQMNHVPVGVRAVYNAAEYLPARKRMMVYWADWLDLKIKEGI